MDKQNKQEEIAMNDVIISPTGVIHGRGRQPHRWVSGLSVEERRAVREGKVVLIKDDCKHHNTSEYKQVVFSAEHKRYNHKNWKKEDTDVRA